MNAYVISLSILHHYSYFRMFMYLIIDISGFILICVTVALFVCVFENPQLYLHFSFTQ